MRRLQPLADWRMRELVRTNNAVLVSAIGALLDGAKIPHMVLDQNMSVLEGSLGILPRRVLVADEDVSAARRLLTDAGLAHELQTRCPLNTSRPAMDAVLGGRLRLRQPLAGHRVGHDAILLAAATGGLTGEQAVDFGAGVGAARVLRWLHALPGLSITLVEIDPALAALAAENARQNGMADARNGLLPATRRTRVRWRRPGWRPAALTAC